MRNWIVAIVLLGAALPAWADERMPQVTNETVKKECGACHMAFQPQFLPRESWRRIMATLPDHFGENATLPEPVRRQVEDYHLANAADATDSRQGRRYYRSIGNGPAPLRITETRWWVGEHRGEVRPGAWSDPRIKSKANCPACHRGAEAGWYDDD